jgi:hypothetical protein
MEGSILNIRNEISSLVNDYSNINFKEKEFIPNVNGSAGIRKSYWYFRI